MIQKITDATGKELTRSRDPRRVRPRVRRGDAAGRLRRPSRAAQRGDGTVEQLTAHLTVDGVEWRADRRGQRSGRRVRPRAARRTAASTSTCRATTSTRSAPARTRRRSPTSSCASAREQTVYGVGLDPNIVTATLRAVVERDQPRHRARHARAAGGRGALTLRAARSARTVVRGRGPSARRAELRP